MGRLFFLASASQWRRNRTCTEARRNGYAFPALAAIIGLSLLILAGTGSAWAGVGGPRPQEPLSKDAIINLTNEARATEGLTVLEENSLLDAIAEARAKDILDKQYFGHVSPTGEAASHVAQKVGYRYRMIAENLAAGAFSTNSKIVECWMQSPGHRKNILSSQMREMGASVVKGRFNGAETWVSVQIFGLRSPVYGRPFNPSYQEQADGVKGDEDTAEKLRRMKRELDAEREFIGHLRAASYEPRRTEDINIRIRAYNAKADQYNRVLAETKATRVAMNLQD